MDSEHGFVDGISVADDAMEGKILTFFSSELDVDSLDSVADCPPGVSV